MSMPGWYPDPSGKPGRFRFWDGAVWSEATTTDPTRATTPARPAASHRGNRGWLYLIGAIVLATILVAYLIIRSIGGTTGGGGEATPDWNSAEPSISAWDETSSPTPPPTGGSIIPCPVTSVSTVSQQGFDGRVHGGGLSYEEVPGWDYESLYLQWVSDFQGQVKTIYPGWMSNVGVGALNAVDGFTDVQASAAQTMQCFASSGYYQDFVGRQDLINIGTQIDGHSAWRIRSNILVENPSLPQVQGDVVDVIVVDLGPESDHLGVFVSSVTIDDSKVQKLVDEAIATLVVD